MKLLVTIEVEVDEASWDSTYGTTGEANRITDVESYVVNQVAQSAAANAGAITAAEQVFVTRTGRVLRNADFEALADEAKRGYD